MRREKRREMTYIDKPYISIHLDYDYLTVGEAGNMLVRLQSALRSLAGLSGKFERDQPRFIVKSIDTKHSMEILVYLSILTSIADIPQNITFYRNMVDRVIQKFKKSLPAITEQKGWSLNVNKGDIDFGASRRSLEELTEEQRRKLVDLMDSLVDPSNDVVIKDEETEVSLSKRRQSKYNSHS